MPVSHKLPALWVAKQQNENVSMFTERPTLDEYNYWKGNGYTLVGILPKGYFSNLTFEDSPVKVKILKEQDD